MARIAPAIRDVTWTVVDPPAPNAAEALRAPISQPLRFAVCCPLQTALNCVLEWDV
jgi:hypothetical protein